MRTPGSVLILLGVVVGAFVASTFDADVPPAVELIADEVGLIESEATMAGSGVSVGAKKVVSAVVSLKAYCIEATKTEYFKLHNRATTSKGDITSNALLATCEQLAAVPHQNDVVTEYGTTIGKSIAADKGTSKYLMEHMNDCILKGKSVVWQRGKKVLFDAKALGLSDEPEYLNKLAVSAGAFANTQTQINSGGSGKVVANWIKSGKADYYKKALARATRRIDAEAKAADDTCTKWCLTAIRAAYEKKCADGCAGEGKLEVLGKMTTACHTGKFKNAPSSCSYEKPNTAEVQKKAMNEARSAMVAAAKAVNEEIMVKEIEAKAVVKEKKDKVVEKEKKVKAKEKAKKAQERQQELNKKAKARQQELNNKAAESRNKESNHKHYFRHDNTCCCHLSHECFGSPSCNVCRRGHHHVWPHECITSRKCNRL